ncbi:HAMP domain-containing histidine kinase [bacterium]|nr:HAMP domain-containing histidine kinase [bacterium]
MEKLNHLKITFVFIVTIIIPSLFLSAFAYQAVEGERVARRVERKRRLLDEARSFARELDEGLRAPAREMREACGRLKGRLRRPQDAAGVLQGLVDVSATTSVAIFASDGRRVFPAGEKAAPSYPAPISTEALAGLEPVAVLRDAALAARGERADRERAIRNLQRLEQASPPATAVAARLEIGRLLLSANDDEETYAVAERELADVREYPIDLVDPLGRPVAALARLDAALAAKALKKSVVYRERLRALVHDLERDAALLPAEDVADIANRVSSRLFAEGAPWDAEAQRALDVAYARRRIDEWHERIDEIFGADIRETLRSYEHGRPKAPRPPDGGAGGGSPRQPLPGPKFSQIATSPSDVTRWFVRHRAADHYEVLLLAPLEREDGSLLGLAAFPVDLDGFARKFVAERVASRHAEGEAAFQVAAASSLPEEDPDTAQAALSFPLDDIRVVASAGELGSDVLARETTTMKLWLIALSIAGIAAGAIVTTRTVLREAKAAELKSDFVTNVTHELRTPLTSIRMFIETLQLGRVEDEAESKECLGIMARETDRLTRLIERLLAFSKIESRKWRFRFSYVPPLELVNEALRVLRQQLGLLEGAPLPIEVESVQKCSPIAVDKDAIVEVLLNLLTNAWKYTPAADRQIHVNVSERRRQVVIDVEDNGIGVPRRDRRRIWKKFERGSNAKKGRVEGSGIGLTLALSIARGHGGTIVLTPLKQGSRFSLILPKV